MNLGNVRASQWHQCLHHPETAYTSWPREALSCLRRNPGSIASASGLTVALRISSEYLTNTVGYEMEVCAVLQGYVFIDHH